MDSTVVIRISGKTARRERAKKAKEKLEVKLVTAIDNHTASRLWRTKHMEVVA